MQNRHHRSMAASWRCVLALALLPCLAAHAAEHADAANAATHNAAAVTLANPTQSDAAVSVAQAEPQPMSAQGSIAQAQNIPEQATGPSTDAVTLDTVIVTAQKREERIQDVPIATSVFSGQQLDDLKIESGGELLRSTPNVNFSKTNFVSYNFSIAASTPRRCR